MDISLINMSNGSRVIACDISHDAIDNINSGYVLAIHYGEYVVWSVYSRMNADSYDALNGDYGFASLHDATAAYNVRRGFHND
jgi:hypothetical protein